MIKQFHSNVLIVPANETKKSLSIPRSKVKATTSKKLYLGLILIAPYGEALIL